MCRKVTIVMPVAAKSVPDQDEVSCFFGGNLDPVVVIGARELGKAGGMIKGEIDRCKFDMRNGV